MGICPSTLRFNPRTYTRCDLSKFVSSDTQICFNPRTYTRCDFQVNQGFISQMEFQSTHLHEVRLCNTILLDNSKEFQSTHLHEVRRLTVDTTNAYREFQSTHLHEVRRTIHPAIDRGRSCFNPRTYTRCDQTRANSP